MEQDDKLKKLYENVSKEYDLPAYDEFRKDMQDDTKRKKLYDAVSKDYDLPDYDTFSSDMGVKKKVQTGVPFLPPGESATPSTENTKPVEKPAVVEAKKLAITTPSSTVMVGPPDPSNPYSVTVNNSTSRPSAPILPSDIERMNVNKDADKVKSAMKFDEKATPFRDADKSQKLFDEFKAQGFSDEAIERGMADADKSYIDKSQADEIPLLNQTEHAETKQRLIGQGAKEGKGEGADLDGAVEEAMQNKRDQFAVNRLSPDDRTIYGLNTQIDAIVQKPKQSPEDRIKLADLQQQAKSLKAQGSKMLYDPKTGEMVGKENASQEAVEYAQQVNQLAEQYSYKDKLLDLRNEAYSKVQYWDKLKETNDKMLAQSVQALLADGGNPNVSNDAKAVKASAENIDAKRNEAMLNYDALNKAIMINQNPGTIREGGFTQFTDRFKQGVANEITFFKGDDSGDLTTKDYYQGLQTILNSAKDDKMVPKEMKAEYEDSFEGELGSAVGGIVGIMPKLVAAEVVTGGMANFAAIPKVVASLKRSASVLDKTTAFLMESGIEAAKFELAGLDPMSAPGFMLPGYLGKYRMSVTPKGKIGAIIAPFIVSSLEKGMYGTSAMEFGGVTESIGSALATNRDIITQLEKTFGSGITDFTKKVIIDFAANTLIAMPGNLKSVAVSPFSTPEALRKAANDLDNNSMDIYQEYTVKRNDNNGEMPMAEAKEYATRIYDNSRSADEMRKRADALEKSVFGKKVDNSYEDVTGKDQPAAEAPAAEPKTTPPPTPASNPSEPASSPVKTAFGTYDDMKGKTIQEVANAIDEVVGKHDEAILPLQEEIAALKKKPKTKENTALIAERQAVVDAMQIDYEDQQFEHSKEIMRGIKAEADARGIELSEDDVTNIHDDLVESLFDDRGREAIWDENFDDVVSGLLKPYEVSNAEADNASKIKERNKIIHNHLLDNNGDVAGAFKAAGYENINGIWVAPEAVEYAKKVSPEVWQHLKDKGIKYLEGGDDGRGLQKTISYDNNNIRGIGVNEIVGEYHSGHDHTVLHELAHHIWQEELTPEQKSIFTDESPVSDYAKSVKKGNETTLAKYDEEDFAELYAKNNGNIEKAIAEKQAAKPAADKNADTTSNNQSDGKDETKAQGGQEGLLKSTSPTEAVTSGGEIAASLPKGGDLKGITEIEYEDDGETMHYGTKTNKTVVSVKGMSPKEILDEINFMKDVLARTKKSIAEWPDVLKEMQSSRTSSQKDIEDATKMHKMSLQNVEQEEKLVIPFYEKHLKAKTNEQGSTIVPGDNPGEQEQEKNSTEAVVASGEATLREIQAVTTEQSGWETVTDKKEIAHIEGNSGAIIKTFGEITIHTANEVIKYKYDGDGTLVKQTSANVSAQVEKIDKHLADIENKLKLLGHYDSSGDTMKDLRENGSRTPEKKFKQDLTKYSKALAEALGYEHDTDKKGKKEYANTNIAPIGGDGTIILWKPNSEYGVYLSFKADADWGNDYAGNFGNDTLDVGEFYWRVTKKDSKYTGYGNRWDNAAITVGELANKIKDAVGEYTDKRFDNIKIPDAEEPKQKSAKEQKLDDDIDDLFDEMDRKSKGKMSSGVDPELLAIAAKIIAKYLEKGLRKLQDIAKEIYKKYGEARLREYWDALKDGYSSTYNRAEDALADEMTDPREVRKFDLEKFIEQLKSEENETNGKSGTAGESSVDQDGKGVVDGQSQSDVLPTSGQQGAGSVGGGKGGEGNRNTEPAGSQGAAPKPSGGDGTGGVTVTLNGNEEVNKDLGGTSVEQPLPDPSESTPVISQTRHNGNFVIPPNYAGPTSFSVSKKLDDNINALKILITLKNENRIATPNEQDQLFKYVGWGGIKEIGFDPNSDNGWSASNSGLKQRIGQVHDLLKELDPRNYKENIDAIKSSTLNAHYTAIPVIRGIYNVLRHAGFKGGAVLEPSAGIGHFIGAMPIDMINNSKTAAIEKDNITAEILRALYPNIISRNDGYEKVSIAPGAADLVISNIPFGTYSVYDPKFAKSKIQAIRQSTSKIHSYFFARALQDVKPGGLIAIVTSAGILDSPSNADLRKHIAKSAEFMGAIRLPNNTFKGNANTEVVTDVIFLRKFDTDETPAQPNKFIESKPATVNHKDKKQQTHEITYNQYFHKNPEMVLGKFEAGGLQTEDQMTVTSTGIDLEKGISDLAEKIFHKKIDSGNNNSEKEIENHYVKNKGQRNGNVVEVKPGVFGVISDQQAIDGNLDQKARDVNVSPDRVREGNATENDIANLAEIGLRVEDFDIKQVNKISIPKKYAGAIHDMIAIRNALNRVYASELGDYTDEAITHYKALLKTAYDDFVKAHGTILQNKTLFELDSDGHNMMALEHVEDKKVVGLADIFTKRVFEKAKRATAAENVSDAVAINLNETGSVDIDRIAELLGVSKDEAIKLGKGVIFKNPKGGFEDNTKYLSGNVRQKLNEAILAAKEDPFYNDNVTALEAVQPAPLNASQIYAPISAPWIDVKHYMDFASKLFQQDIKITRLSTGSVNVTGSDPHNTQVTDAYGTPRLNGFDLLEEVMQNRVPLVKRTVEDEDGRKTTIVDEAATAVAIEKADKIKREFDKWLWKDDKRRNELVDFYNDNFNGTIVPKNDGSHLTFPGYIGHKLRSHQMDGVWMIIQQMNGILDHIVGSGKSLIMVVAAMKMKQMGMIKKPIILGLKANTSDLARTFKDSYPMAKVLSPKEKDFSPENRKAFFAKMANNDWDAIIMTHDQFGMIQQSADIQQEIIQQEIDALEEDILAAKNNDLSKREINGLETRKLNLAVKLQNAALMKKDHSLKSFEEMGIDFMFVDESQQFKNLTYNTIQRGVAGLGDPKGSTKAFNLLFAARTLQKFYSADKGTVFASGTPISNTMVEMYLLFKYLRPNKMKELGINSFDNWANTFASVGSEIEFGVTNSLKPKTRMRNFMNVPEMATMYREIADVRNEKNLKLPRPEFKKTFRVKTSKPIAKNETIFIDGNKYRVIGGMKGLSKNEHWLSLSSVGKDIQPAKNGNFDYENVSTPYTDSEGVNGLLVNVSPTKEQRRFGKRIQEFAKTKDGSRIGRVLTDKQKKAYMLLATNLASKMAIDMRLVDPTYADSEVGKLGVAADTILEHYKESDKHKGIQLVFSDIGTPKSANPSINLFDLLESRGIDNDTLETIFGSAAFSETPRYPPIKDVRKRIATILEYSEEQIDDAITESNEATFNIYQSIKDKLVKRGIPANEIAFIHDYNTAAKKEQLFNDARSGKVRVIIGSTSKLGTGVNIQNRIVAMHHIDVPWRPSDMEQRNGRGIRQGNLITEEFYDNQLPVYYYATEYTLDAYKYQLLDTKQQFIDQAKTTDGKVREISEGDGDEENGVSFATMTAVISGNPVLLEKAKIDKKVKELDAAEKGFSQEKYTVQDKIARSEQGLSYTESRIKRNQEDIKLFESNSTKNEKTGEWNFKEVIGGVEFTERKLAGEALLQVKSDYIKEMIKAHPILSTKSIESTSFAPSGHKIVGHIAGYDIVMQADYTFESNGKAVWYEFTPSIYVVNPNNKSVQAAIKSDDPVYLGSFAHRQIRGIADDLLANEREKSAYEKDIADKEKYLSELPDEFPRAKEYEEALATQKKIDQTLSEMAAESAKALPTSDVIEADGTRIRSVNEVMDLINEGWDDEIYAISENGDVQKITSYDDLDTAEEGSKFYRYDAEAKSIDDEINDAKKDIDDLEGDNSDAGELGMNNIVTKKRVKLAAAYTKLAYLYLKKGMNKLSDFIKVIGDKAHDFIVDAWNKAKEKYTKERIAKAFDDAKIKNKLFGIMPPFNLFPAIWNGTMDFTKKAILAGTRTKPEIEKAIQDGLAHAKNELAAAGGPVMSLAEEKTFKARMRATMLRIGKTPSFALPNQPISDAEKKVAQEMFNQMLNPKDKPSTLPGKVKDFFLNLSKHIDNPFVYVTRLEDDVLKKYPNAQRMSRVPLGRVFEQSYTGPAKLAVEDFVDEVLKGLSNTELQSLHEYIAARRVIDRLKDQDNIKATGNVTIQQALAQLENIQDRLSPSQYQKVVDRGELFQKHADGIMLELYEGGLISQETLDAVMDSKDFYAPFSVVQNIFTNLTKKADGKAQSTVLHKIKGISSKPADFTLNDLNKLQAGVDHKIITQDEFYRGAQELLDGMYSAGTLTEEQYTNESIKLADPGFAVNNIFDRMAEMIYKSRILGERNKTMERIHKLREVDEDNHFFKEVEGFELRYDANGQPFMFPKNIDQIKAPEGFAPIQYKIDGKTKFIAVNEEAAKALRGINDFEMNGVMKLINLANKVARAGIITYSPSFLFANSVIDNFRSLTMSKYGAIAGKDIAEKTINAVILLPQMIEALGSGLLANFTGIRTKQYEEWMKSKSFTRGAFDDIFNDPNHKITEKINMTTPQQAMSMLKYILTAVPRLGVSLEQMPKIYTYTRGMDVEGVDRVGFTKWAKETVLRLNALSGKSGDELVAALDEIAFDTLNRSASPNFPAAGNWAKYMSGLFQFFSARVKGEFSDWRTITNTEGGTLGIRKNKVASGLAMGILKIGVYALLPMLYAAIKNMWNDDDEKSFDTVNNPDKNNNILFKTGSQFYYDGEKYDDYVKLPLRGLPATANTMVVNYIDYLKKNNPEAFKNMAVQAMSNATPINLNLNYKEGDDLAQKSMKLGNAIAANTNPLLKFGYEELRGINSYNGYPLTNERLAKAYYAGNDNIMPWEVKLKYGTQGAEDISKAIYNTTGVKVTAAFIDHLHSVMMGGILNQLDSNALSKRIYRSEELYPIKK